MAGASRLRVHCLLFGASMGSWTFKRLSKVVTPECIIGGRVPAFAVVSSVEPPRMTDFRSAIWSLFTCRDDHWFTILLLCCDLVLPRRDIAHAASCRSRTDYDTRWLSPSSERRSKEFFDNRFTKELEDTGFIKELYGQK
jgi:hypothetical protein